MIKEMSEDIKAFLSLLQSWTIDKKDFWYFYCLFSKLIRLLKIKYYFKMVKRFEMIKIGIIGSCITRDVLTVGM